MILKENIIDTIYDILKKEFRFKGSNEEECMNISLTSPYFNLGGIQLYQLLMRIEETYNIYFEPSDIEKNGFFTLEDVIKIVEIKVLSYK